MEKKKIFVDAQLLNIDRERAVTVVMYIYDELSHAACKNIYMKFPICCAICIWIIAPFIRVRKVFSITWRARSWNYANKFCARILRKASPGDC